MQLNDTFNSLKVDMNLITTEIYIFAINLSLTKHVHNIPKRKIYKMADHTLNR